MHIGTLVLWIAATHSAVGTALYWPELVSACADGIVASVPDRGDRAAAFWFLYTGVVFAALGWIVREGERERAYLPRAVLPALLLLGLAVVIPMPASGGWLFFAVAAVAWRRTREPQLQRS